MWYGDEEERIPILFEEKEGEVQPCDQKAFNWCCRICTMTIISVFLLSMSLVAWQQYSDAVAIDDTEQPKILAMANTCRNTTWNTDIIEVDGDIKIFEVSYYEDGSYDLLYADTMCDMNVSFPMIYLNDTAACCKFVLYNTI